MLGEQTRGEEERSAVGAHSSAHGLQRDQPAVAGNLLSGEPAIVGPLDSTGLSVETIDGSIIRAGAHDIAADDRREADPAPDRPETESDREA